MTNSFIHNPHHTVEWDDGGREPQCPPNPEYLNGRHLDVSGALLADPEIPTCTVKLPYPAPRCGAWFVTCQRCRQKFGVTAAGRLDDPVSIKVRCKSDT